MMSVIIVLICKPPPLEFGGMLLLDLMRVQCRRRAFCSSVICESASKQKREICSVVGSVSSPNKSSSKCISHRAKAARLGSLDAQKQGRDTNNDESANNTRRSSSARQTLTLFHERERELQLLPDLSSCDCGKPLVGAAKPRDRREVNMFPIICNVWGSLLKRASDGQLQSGANCCPAQVGSPATLDACD